MAIEKSPNEMVRAAAQEYLDQTAEIQAETELVRKIRPTDRNLAIHFTVLTFRPIRTPEISEQFETFHRQYTAPFLLLNQEKIPAQEVISVSRGSVESLDPHQANYVFVQQLVAADVWQTLQYLASIPNLVIGEAADCYRSVIQAEALDHQYLVSLAQFLISCEVSREGLEPPTKKV